MFDVPYSFQSRLRSTPKTGFTLVEVMVAIFIFAITVAGVSAFVIYYLQNYSFSFEQNQAIGLAQGAITQIIREVRETRSAEDGAWALSQTDDNTFIFFADVTNDGRSDRVRYFLEGSELKKGVIEPTQPPVSYPTENEQITTVVSYVDNQGISLFTYYNGGWPKDTITNPLPADQRLLSTRYVSIYLRINVNPDTGSQPFELTSGVQMRSLKDNL